MMTKFGTCFIALGSLCLIAALSITILNIREENRAEQTATAQVALLQDLIQSKPDDQQAIPEEQVVMPTLTRDSHAYIGILQIPALDLTLPVQSQWSKELLKQSPCLYKGTLSDGFIIAGHNYKTHFKPLLRILPGDEVLFTDVDGNVWHYQVRATEIIPGYDGNTMLAGDWDLSLFTCTYSSKDRFTVRCNLAQ